MFLRFVLLIVNYVNNVKYDVKEIFLNFENIFLLINKGKFCSVMLWYVELKLFFLLILKFMDFNDLMVLVYEGVIIG